MALPAHVGYSFTPTLHNDIYASTNPATNPSLSQPGKVVLITGAGRGIGRSIALRYAEASVSTLIICSRTASDLDALEADIQSLKKDAKVRKCIIDVTDEEGVKELAEEVKKEVGKLDVLVNNAGTGDPWVPLTETEPKAWWKTWEVNVKGPYLMMHAFLPLMVETAKSTGTTVDVVNLVSIGAHVVFPGAASYQTSKLALLRLTEFLDAEYSAQGVNALAVHPGGVLTELAKCMPEQLQSHCTDTPDLCGGFVVWLTKGARTWLAGRYLSSSWDVEELEANKDEIVKGDKLKVRMVV